MHVQLLLVVLVGSFLATLASEPIARRLQILDRPADLKIHATAVTRFGGLGIFVGVVIGILMLPPKSHQMLIGVAAMWLVGAIDDRWTLSATQKLGGQIAAALILALGVVNATPIPSGAFLGAAAFLLVLGCANAMNLVDGMNGLAAGNGFLIFAGFGFLLALHGHDFAFPLIVATSLLGFLPFNFPGAWLFMGDSGSLLLGYLIALVLVQLLAIDARLFVCGLLIAIMPLFDLALGVARRALSKKHIFAADRGHFYDRLNERTRSPVATVLLTYCGTVVCVVFGLALSFSSLHVALLGFCIITFGLGLMSWSLGWLQEPSDIRRA